MAEITKETVSPKRLMWRKDLQAETFRERATITTGTWFEYVSDVKSFIDIRGKWMLYFSVHYFLLGTNVCHCSIFPSLFCFALILITTEKKRSKEEEEWAEKEIGTLLMTGACRYVLRDHPLFTLWWTVYYCLTMISTAITIWSTLRRDYSMCSLRMGIQATSDTTKTVFHRAINRVRK